jgi:hypothetical protein
MRMNPTAGDGPPRSGMAHVVERNIRALLAQRQAEDRRAGRTGWPTASPSSPAACGSSTATS